MKAKLIHRYYELRERRQWADISLSKWESMGLSFQMLRIDSILMDRYRYDISLTKTLN